MSGIAAGLFINLKGSLVNKLIVALLTGFFAVTSFAQAPAGAHGQVKSVTAGAAPHKTPAKKVHKTVRKTHKKVVKSALK